VILMGSLGRTATINPLQLFNLLSQ